MQRAICTTQNGKPFPFSFPHYLSNQERMKEELTDFEKELSAQITGINKHLDAIFNEPPVNSTLTTLQCLRERVEKERKNKVEITGSTLYQELTTTRGENNEYYKQYIDGLFVGREEALDTILTLLDDEIAKLTV